MIIRTSKSNKIKVRESLILPRLIKVIENFDVTIVLLNGTKVKGTVESNGKKIKTVSLKTALSEFSISNKIYNDLNEYLLEDEQLQHIKDFYDSGIDNTDNVNSKYTKNDNDFKIVGDYKSFVLLKDSEVEFKGKVIKFPNVSIPELHISTLEINGTNKNDHGVKNKFNKGNNDIATMDIGKMMINLHKNEIKNEAFIKCNRIGTNNTKK